MDNFEVVESFEEPEFFECYNCNWVGEHACTVEGSSLFDPVNEDDTLSFCPACGEPLS